MIDAPPPRDPARTDLRRRAGFSLIEALIMLVIAGAALTVVFSVGLRASEMAFRLGRRALDVSDRQLAASALRTVIDGLDLPPRGLVLSPEAGVLGRPDRLSGPAVLAAATPCAPSGPVARMTVRVRGDARGDVVTCQADAGREVILADLRPHRASLAYSEDGVRWADSWEPPRAVRLGLLGTSPRLTTARLYVRLATRDGGFEVLGRAVSAPPSFYPQHLSPEPAPRPGAEL